MEPAAMLVRALEVDVRRERDEARPQRRQAVVHDAGVEPDVHHVLALLVHERLVAEEMPRIQREPGLDAAFGDELGHLLEQLRRLRMRLAGFLVNEHRERHAPGALARDAPVRARLDHAGDALLAPARDPAHAADRRQRIAAQSRLLHAEEPLRRRAEDHRRLVAPAMRVAVVIRLEMDQPPALAQRLDDLRVRIEHREAFEQRRARDEAAIVADRVVDRQAIAPAHLVIVRAVAGRRVHGAGAGIERHVIAEDHGHFALVERVLEPQALERLSLDLAEHAVRARADALGKGLDQGLGDDEALRPAGARELGEHVVVERVQADRLVCGQRPRCRGPDRDRCGRKVLGREPEAARGVVRVRDLESHVHGRRVAILVFDLGFRQRGTAVEAPVHGLEAAHEVAAADDRGEGAQLLGLEARSHREVGIVPVAHDAEPLEVRALDLDLARGIFAAGLAERVGVELLADAAVLLLDLLFDREPMAVPAGHIGRVEAVERARLDDDVLQHLVHGVADVDHAVRIGRSIHEHELGAARGAAPQLHINVVRKPARNPLRLAAREVRLHREGRVRQVDGLLVVHAYPRAASSLRASRASSCICAVMASTSAKRISSRSRAMKSTSSRSPYSSPS